MRQYSFWDHVILKVEKALRDSGPSLAERPNPSTHLSEGDLSAGERNHAAGLMRVNHVGEVCAQALYQGQAWMARSSDVQKKMQQAAKEENDHLQWCEQRLVELQARPSYLNYFWYAGALLMGLIAGSFGDRISLGFLAETEHQVERHLGEHLNRLPYKDKKSRAIVAQMRLEEMQHATTAEKLGAAPLPFFIRWSMRASANFMKWVAYRL